MPGRRRKRGISTTLIGLVVAISCAATDVGAQEADRAREQIRRLQQRLQAQRETHAKEIAALDQRIRTSQAAVADLTRKLEAEQRNASARRQLGERLALQARQLAALTDASKADAARMAELLAASEHAREDIVRQLAQVRSSLQDSERVATSCRESLDLREREVAVCMTRNEALYNTGRDVLDRYNRQGLFDRALRSEPVLGIKRVQIENEVQDLRDRLEDGRLAPPQKPTR